MIPGDYDYLNARVRGMASQMVTRETFDHLLAAEGENLLVDVLLGSPYAPQLREALTVAKGMAAVESALRRNLHDTYAKVMSMAPPRPREWTGKSRTRPRGTSVACDSCGTSIWWGSVGPRAHLLQEPALAVGQGVDAEAVDLVQDLVEALLVALLGA